MKITKFLKIKNYRIFRDFSWPNGLLPFARYNLFYGWNGSGKSTLSSLFALLQKKEPSSSGEVTIEVDGATQIQSAHFSTAVIPTVRVFNSDFVNDTLLAIKNANAKPILYIGRGVDDARTLEAKREELANVERDLISAIKEANDTTKAVDGYATDQARIVKNHFSGSKKFVTYNKTKFIEDINRIKNQQPSLNALGEAEKATFERARHLQPKSDISYDKGIVIDLKQLVEQVSAALDQTVVSSVIEELAKDPPLASWIQNGLFLHSGERHTATCRFCGNSFSEETRKRYEAHFNDAYTRFQAMLGGLCSRIESRLKQLEPMFPAEAGFYDNLQAEYKAAVAKAKSSNEKVKLLLQALLKAVESKKSKPFERMGIEVVFEKEEFSLADMATIEAEVTGNLDAVDAIVQKHNAQTQSIEKDRADAYDKLVDDFLLSAIPTYDSLKSKEVEAINKRNVLQGQQNVIKAQITEIELRLTESRKPVEELNKELHSYLGRNELSFELEGTGYKLLRSGTPADNLSEGECTAITFLYFLKTLTDKDFDITNGIVVIDDPVSSLDDNALFSAFAYMKERVKDCGQLFILTHNFSFFKQVKNWIFHIDGQKKKNVNLHPGRFYALKCSVVDNKRAAEIGELDPLLLQFESEYHYLFKTLHDIANSTGDEELSCYYNVPNMARRLLESFLAHYVPNRQGELFHKMEGVPYDGAVKTRILRLLNTYSHLVVVDEPEHDPTVLSETREVIKELLEMIKALDEKHYNGMVSLISANAPDTGENAS